MLKDNPFNYKEIMSDESRRGNRLGLPLFGFVYLKTPIHIKNQDFNYSLIAL